MIFFKCIKYFWKQYLTYFIFLIVMLYFVGGYVFEFTRLYTKVNPYGFVDEENTYKVEGAVVVENENNSMTYAFSNLEELIGKYADYESIDAYASAVRCPGYVILPEQGSGSQTLYYINPEADEVIEVDYIYGGWFDEKSEEPQVVLGNGWAEYYDAGDDIKVYFGDANGREFDFKVAGVLDINSTPNFQNSNRDGNPMHESGDDYNIYFSDFDFLKGTDFLYSIDIRLLVDNKINNLIIRTDDIDNVKEIFKENDIFEISYYYTERYNILFFSNITEKMILFSLLTVFGIVAMAYSTGRKINLLYYILSLNGMSRRRFIFINVIQTVMLIVMAIVPTFISQLYSYRLEFENTIFRCIIMIFVAIVVELVFVFMFSVLSRKKLQVLYRESLEN